MQRRWLQRPRLRREQGQEGYGHLWSRRRTVWAPGSGVGHVEPIPSDDWRRGADASQQLLNSWGRAGRVGTEASRNREGSGRSFGAFRHRHHELQEVCWPALQALRLDMQAVSALHGSLDQPRCQVGGGPRGGVRDKSPGQPERRGGHQAAASAVTQNGRPLDLGDGIRLFVSGGVGPRLTVIDHGVSPRRQAALVGRLLQDVTAGERHPVAHVYAIKRAGSLCLCGFDNCQGRVRQVALHPAEASQLVEGGSRQDPVAPNRALGSRRT